MAFIKSTNAYSGKEFYLNIDSIRILEDAEEVTNYAGQKEKAACTLIVFIGGGTATVIGTKELLITEIDGALTREEKRRVQK